MNVVMQQQDCKKRKCPDSLTTRDELENADPKKIKLPYKRSPGPVVVKRRNARERCRVQHINTCFDILRQCVPFCGPGRSKLSKLDTLRAASHYIYYLTNLLQTDAISNGAKFWNSNVLAYFETPGNDHLLNYQSSFYASNSLYFQTCV
ncbi:hypothetical protein GJ496_005000 [Pomphorhynchus laevis]|nr:hypothetical protein GJ496_005000 [Pomphorhynchus laevis]